MILGHLTGRNWDEGDGEMEDDVDGVWSGLIVCTVDSRGWLECGTMIDGGDMCSIQ